MKITLHIERLILDGVSVEHPRLLRGALETELTTLLTSGGLSHEVRAGGVIPQIRSPGLALGQGREPVTFGHQLARAVYRGIGGPK
jgi:hypothetical protein